MNDNRLRFPQREGKVLDHMIQEPVSQHTYINNTHTHTFFHLSFNVEIKCTQKNLYSGKELYKCNLLQIFIENSDKHFQKIL